MTACRIKKTTTTTTTTTALGSKFRPSNKQQVKVAIDPKTGLYRPIKAFDKQGKSLKILPEDGGMSTWDKVKEVVYNSVDGMKEMPKNLVIKQTKNKDSSSSSSSSSKKVIGGYADLERELLEDGSNKKNQKISTHFLGSSSSSSSSSAADQIVRDKKKDIKGSTSNRNENEPLVPPTGLEKAKTIFWGGIDAMDPSQKTLSSLGTTTTTSAMSANDAMKSFQPSVRARMVTSDEFLQALSNLESPNPVVRLAAGRKIRSLAKSEQTKLQDTTEQERITKRNNPLQSVQQTFWKATDTVQATKEQIENFPRKITDTYKVTVETVDETVKLAKQVPSKVRQQVDTVKSTINKTIDTTQKTVKNVQEFPTRIESNLKTTNQTIQRNAQQMQETVRNIKRGAEDLSMQSKVLLGLEKPLPKPPSTPPPEPLTPQKAAYKILSLSGSLVGQVAWLVGKEIAKLAWKATSVVATKGGEVLSTKMKEYQQQQKRQAFQPKAPPLLANKTNEDPVGQTKKSTSAAPGELTVEMLAAREQRQEKEMSQLEMEIEEALRMADAAIQSAQAEIEESKSKSVYKKDKSDDDNDTNDDDDDDDDVLRRE